MRNAQQAFSRVIDRDRTRELKWIAGELGGVEAPAQTEEHQVAQRTSNNTDQRPVIRG
jgi:hypothetical protein